MALHYLPNSYRKIRHREIISVFFSLKFVNQLHHWAPALKEKTTTSHCKKEAFESYSSVLCIYDDETHAGSRKSRAMLYSVGFVLPCKQRRFHPRIIPSKLPKMFSTSQGKMACSSFKNGRGMRRKKIETINEEIRLPLMTNKAANNKQQSLGN